MLRGLSVYDYDVLSFNYEDVVIDYVMDNVYLDMPFTSVLFQLVFTNCRNSSGSNNSHSGVQ